MNPGFSHCRQILYCLSHQGSPRILKWVAYSFSGGSSQPTIKPESPALQADSLPAELPGKPKNIQSTEFSRPDHWNGQPSPGDLPNPGIKPRSPALQADSSPAEPPGKPKNTEVGSLSLLQRIFPTQESNPGLPHCRQILHQLSHQGSPQLRNLEVIQRHSILTATFEEGRNGQRAEF